ncbi:MAG: hypothetical protein KGJ74_07110 [Betaproteobacteria bacterium]|nr:hypothetical protein [Betaproteobacteria bacterium]
MKLARIKAIIMLSTGALAGCANSSPVAPHYSQMGYCLKRANTAYRIQMDKRNGVSASLLAQQIEESHESETSKMLDLTAVSQDEAPSPLEVRQKIYVNCMHMDIPPTSTQDQRPPASPPPGCPAGYTCTPKP